MGWLSKNKRPSGDPQVSSGAMSPPVPAATAGATGPLGAGDPAGSAPAQPPASDRPTGSPVPASSPMGRFGPLVHIPSFDLAPDELSWQLPVNGELYRLVPGPDRPDYSLVVLARPLHFYPQPGFDLGRVAADQRVEDRKGRTMVRVQALLVCARYVGQQLHPGMVELPINVAYVIDTSLARDEMVDFRKIEYAGVGYLSEGHGERVQPAVAPSASAPSVPAASVPAPSAPAPADSAPPVPSAPAAHSAHAAPAEPAATDGPAAPTGESAPADAAAEPVAAPIAEAAPDQQRDVQEPSVDQGASPPAEAGAAELDERAEPAPGPAAAPPAESSSTATQTGEGAQPSSDSPESPEAPKSPEAPATPDAPATPAPHADSAEAPAEPALGAGAGGPVAAAPSTASPAQPTEPVAPPPAATRPTQTTEAPAPVVDPQAVLSRVLPAVVGTLRSGIVAQRRGPVHRLSATVTLDDDYRVVGLTGNADGTPPIPTTQTFEVLNRELARLSALPPGREVRTVSFRVEGNSIHTDVTYRSDAPQS